MNPTPLTENMEAVIRLLADGKDPNIEMSPAKVRPSIKGLLDRGLLRESSTAMTGYIFTVAGRNYITNVIAKERSVGIQAESDSS